MLPFFLFIVLIHPCFGAQAVQSTAMPATAQTRVAQSSSASVVSATAPTQSVVANQPQQVTESSIPEKILRSYPEFKAASFKEVSGDRRKELIRIMTLEHIKALQNYLLDKIGKKGDKPEVLFKNLEEIDIQKMALALTPEDLEMVKFLIIIKQKETEDSTLVRKLLLSFADKVQRVPEEKANQQTVAYYLLHNYIKYFK